MIKYAKFLIFKIHRCITRSAHSWHIPDVLCVKNRKESHPRSAFTTMALGLSWSPRSTIPIDSPFSLWTLTEFVASQVQYKVWLYISMLRSCGCFSGFWLWFGALMTVKGCKTTYREWLLITVLYELWLHKKHGLFMWNVQKYLKPQGSKYNKCNKIHLIQTVD